MLQVRFWIEPLPLLSTLTHSGGFLHVLLRTCDPLPQLRLHGDHSDQPDQPPGTVTCQQTAQRPAGERASNETLGWLSGLVNDSSARVLLSWQCGDAHTAFDQWRRRVEAQARWRQSVGGAWDCEVTDSQQNTNTIHYTSSRYYDTIQGWEMYWNFTQGYISCTRSDNSACVCERSGFGKNQEKYLENR